MLPVIEEPSLRIPQNVQLTDDRDEVAGAVFTLPTFVSEHKVNTACKDEPQATVEDDFFHDLDRHVEEGAHQDAEGEDGGSEDFVIEHVVSPVVFCLLYPSCTRVARYAYQNPPS